MTAMGTAGEHNRRFRPQGSGQSPSPLAGDRRPATARQNLSDPPTRPPSPGPVIAKVLGYHDKTAPGRRLRNGFPAPCSDEARRVSARVRTVALYSGMGVACLQLSCLIEVSRLRGADLRGLDWVSADLIR